MNFVNRDSESVSDYYKDNIHGGMASEGCVHKQGSKESSHLYENSKATYFAT